MKKFYASKTFKLGNHIEIIIKSGTASSKAYINVNLFTLGTEQSFSFGLTLKKDSTFNSQEFGNFVKNNYQNLFSSSTINGKTLFIEKNTLDDETTFYNYSSDTNQFYYNPEKRVCIKDFPSELYSFINNK